MNKVKILVKKEEFHLNKLLIFQTSLFDISDQLFPVLVIIRNVRQPDVHILHQFIITETVRRGIVQLLSWLGDVGKFLPIPL